MFRAARTRLAIPPPPGIFYLPPANQQDFTKATSYRSWQQLVRDNYTNAIWGPSDDPEDPQYYSPTGIAYRLPDARALADGLYASYGVSNLQYRATEDLVTMATQHNLTPVEAKISWTGFPKNLQGKPDKYKAAEKPGYWNAPKARPQDEYCEWFSKRDSSGKIVSVQITCESPEYWQHLFEQEPETCLALYKQYISKDVTLDSLVDSRGQYDLYNKWNTVAGAMHLNCPPNSLFAELYIAAEAGTMWGKNGAPKTDPQDLVNCAEYGVNTRASDPHIGASVNTLVQQGMVVSIQRPVGLYLDKLKLNGWQNNQRKLFAPDQLDKIVTYQRGSDGRNLRINIEIPAGWGYVLGDCYIAGQNIAWAGQVVESAATIFLTGLAIDGADFVKPDAKQRAVVPCKDAWTQKPPTVGPQPVVVPWYPPQMRNRAAPRHSPQRQ